jgi:hypothetical protein
MYGIGLNYMNYYSLALLYSNNLYFQHQKHVNFSRPLKAGYTIFQYIFVHLSNNFEKTLVITTIFNHHLPNEETSNQQIDG